MARTTESSLGLSRQQAKTLTFIREYLKHHGYPPSVVEISKHLGQASGGTAAGALNGLERKGYIRRTPGIARSLQVIEQPKTTST
jgi:repressor LexA